MSETQNNYNLVINAPIDQVWFALTTSDEISKYMKAMKVESDWQKGSAIKYSCYGDDGNIMNWEGVPVIWKGIIEVFEKNIEFTCVYPNPDTALGITKETYLLEEIDENTTELTFNQFTISKETAARYQHGTSNSLNMLKDYLEQQN